MRTNQRSVYVLSAEKELERASLRTRERVVLWLEVATATLLMADVLLWAANLILLKHAPALSWRATAAGLGVLGIGLFVFNCLRVATITEQEELVRGAVELEPLTGEARDQEVQFEKLCSIALKLCRDDAERRHVYDWRRQGLRLLRREGQGIPGEFPEFSEVVKAVVAFNLRK